jgi:hypothetical protein
MATKSSSNAEMHSAIGASIHQYSKVEVAQTRILEAILNIETKPAALLFFSIQNVRTRNDLIEGLLRHYREENLRPYWAKCSAFLFKLSLYRNAIAHWIPGWHYHLDFVQRKITGVTAFISDPKAGPTKEARSLQAGDLKPFDEDCQYIAHQLNQFAAYLKMFKSNAHGPFRDIYRQLTIRLNQAVLRPPRTPTAQQPRQRPFPASARPKGPKPSAKQRRQRALSHAAKRGKRT